MIETKVEGSPSSVDKAAQFLATLKTGCDEACDDTAEARRQLMGSWEGTAADAYRDVVNKLIKAASEEAATASRAGRKFEEYSGRLEGIQNRMSDRRREASDGGLTVSGTVIQAPADAFPPAALPAGATPDVVKQWQQDDNAFQEQKKKVDLYNELAHEVMDDLVKFQQQIDSELKSAASEVSKSALAEIVDNALESAPIAAVSLGIDLNARSLDDYAKSATKTASTLRQEVAAAREAARSGNPARAAQGRSQDGEGSRQEARALEAGAEDAGHLARKLPIVGYAISAGADAYAIAHGESPGKVITSEGAGLAGGAVGALAVGAGAAALSVGAPVLVVAGVAALAGWGASSLGSYGWDHWVPDDAKQAIDDGLKDFGNGVKDVASDVGDGVRNVADDLKFW